MTQLNASDKWKQLPWKKFRRIVFRLQRRIGLARKANNYKLVRQLQKLLLRSKAAKFLAVRQVTQLNKGRKAGGRRWHNSSLSKTEIFSCFQVKYQPMAT